MAKLTIKDIRKLGKLEKEKKLNDLHEELLLLRSKSSMGGSLENPSRIKEIRKAIARIKTVMNEEKLGINIASK